MAITFPTNTKTIIDEIRGAIGRNVDFYVTTSSYTCQTCSLDPTTGTSTDSFCMTCSGLYYIPMLYSTTISGHITWGKSDKLNWVTGGQFFEGDCRLQIEYSDINLDLVNGAKYVVVDGKRLTIDTITLRGAQELNRIVLNLSEEE